MANKTIPQLPEQTGKTDNDLLAIVDSGETVTSKIKVSTLLAGTGGKFIDAGGINNIIPDYYSETAINDDVDNSFIAGGTGNAIGAVGGVGYDDNVILGGLNNSLRRGVRFTMIGGNANDLYAGGSNATDSVVIGGNGNTDESWKGATIASTTSTNDGRLNCAILGGVSNTISNASNQSAIIGGNSNTMTGDYSSVFGGENNTISADRSVIAGGNNNSISLNANFIGASSTTTIGNTQQSSIISSSNSTINNGSGSSSIIIGGNGNIHGSNSRGRYNGIYSSKDSSIIGAGAGFYDSQLVILGGNNNTVTHSATYPNMTTIGGQTNSITDATNGVIVGSSGSTLSGHSNSVIIGGSGLTSNTDNEVQVPNLTIANYASLNFSGDTAAATGGVPLGGVYHNAGALRVRIT